jgi:predicted small metal-binding protein
LPPLKAGFQQFMKPVRNPVDFVPAEDQKRCKVVKILRCRDVGMDCGFEARATTEEEILKTAAAPAQSVHNMKDIPIEALEKVRAAIRDE